MSAASGKTAVAANEPDTIASQDPELSRGPAPSLEAIGAASEELDGIVHILTCGSVDDGKSTLIGRLLWDASDLPEDTRARIARSHLPNGQPDFSLLVDGLAAEREQGITIDIAWRYVDAGRRRYVIIDSPGHEQYTRNMATGASHADIAVMLVDARHGVKPQTRRHAAILGLLGVRRVVLAVNKMDLTGWSEERFREIERDFHVVMDRFSFEGVVAIPVAATSGDNVAQRSAAMDWYRGPTLLDQLGSVPGRGPSSVGPFRLPVQMVLRRAPDFRGLAGTISSGSISVGAQVIDTTSGRSARVRRIATMDGDLDTAHGGTAVVIQLDTDLDIARGAVLAPPDAPALLVSRCDVRLFWMSDAPLDATRGILLRSATDLVPVSSIAVTAKLDLETLDERHDTVCAHNDVVLATIDLGRATALDLFATSKMTGAVVLVDALTGATLAGGVVVALHQTSKTARRPGFRLTTAMLARGVCAGLAPDSAEFRRRATEVAAILQEAGVEVDVEIAGSDDAGS